MTHYFYLARCSDGSLYAGTCLDLKSREAKHNDGTGAKYTRSRRPVAIIHHERFKTLSAARKREAQVKRFSRADKESLLMHAEPRRARKNPSGARGRARRSRA
jgi:putative endonuclease